MKIGFFHHGTFPSPEITKLLVDKRMATCGRNANEFSKDDKEKFDEVVVDEGKNTEAIRAYYESVNVPVKTIEEFLGEVAPEPAPEPEAGMQNPDAEVKKNKKGKKQGEPAPEPEAAA